MATKSIELDKWVKDVAHHTKPQSIHWCNGSDKEYEQILSVLLAEGGLLPLNQERYPNCYLHRSDPNDVARVEDKTFVCTKLRDDAGLNNNWMSPTAGHSKVDALFAGCMSSRVMYVVPYCMGPIDSEYSRCGVEITDSPYVVANMHKMTRVGLGALGRIEKEGKFIKALHSVGDLSPERRLIMHFPEEDMIKSIGSGYGGNALLGKKCHALRIASYQARHEGWLAEHMLILGIESPAGKTSYIAAAFPSACGKTNLAMLIPPATYKGWKIWTVGDDIAWMHPGSDGRLWAINPEAGFFGVVPGTSTKTNPNAMKMITQDTIFTNVAVTKDNCPWWEGKGSNEVPVTDWQGRPWLYGNQTPAAHPNARFTVSATNCPSYSVAAEDPRGVPIDAIVFGGRRPSLIPLVYEAKNWAHGVLVGAVAASQTTAAATGTVGLLRRDPMAMKPFCGYNFADYWQHWLNVGSKLQHAPQIFNVNWFRQDEKGKFLWPGFGENIRVLEWIVKRCNSQVTGVKTPVGIIPSLDEFNTKGLQVAKEHLKTLLDVKPQGWKEELAAVKSYLVGFGERLPSQLLHEINVIQQDLNH